MPLSAEFIGRLERVCSGRLSFNVRALQTGAELSCHADRVVSTASVYKLFVLLHVACGVQEGVLNWKTLLAMQPEHQSPGNGVLKDLTPGLILSLHDACQLMIACSDNTAANMVVEHVGIDAVNLRLRLLGFHQTALVGQRRSPEAPRLPYVTGRTTPRETANLLQGLAQNTLTIPAACQQVQAMLNTQQDHSMIARHLPPGWCYGGKTGADADLRADVGMVISLDGDIFVLALFCHGLPVPSTGPQWTVDHPGVRTLAELAQEVWGSLS